MSAFDNWIAYNNGLNGSFGEPDVGTTLDHLEVVGVSLCREVQDSIDAAGLGAVRT